METVLHKSETRGHFDYGWLDTRHTFSFARYHDPERIHFGTLRVLNDDIVLPGEGFGKHPHDNMEIISIPLSGELQHEDSMGHTQVIHENEVQVMSAGTGIFHSEYNANREKPVNFLQIWIFPSQKGVTPVYDQKFFEPADGKDKWQELVAPSGDGSLTIHQNARLSRIFLSEGNSIVRDILPGAFGVYFFVVSGEVEISGQKLNRRDGLGVITENPVEIKANKGTYLLSIEIPQ